MSWLGMPWLGVSFMIFDTINSCDGAYRNSLDVRFTKACDNRCPFCIERSGLAPCSQDVEKMIRRAVESDRQEILVLGGEPLLDLNAIKRFVDGVKNACADKKIYITTSLPHSIVEDYGAFYDVASKISGLNVSLQHYDPMKNNDLLHATCRFDRIALLQKILSDFAEKTRVSLNLVKGNIDNRVELYAALRKLESIGCQHVKINELQHEPELYVSFEDITGRRLKSPFSHGCQTDINLGFNMRITLKRSCFLVEESRMATLPDFIKLAGKLIRRKGNDSGRCMVLYEDGSLSKGWRMSRSSEPLEMSLS